jgi:hypothetical protein
MKLYLTLCGLLLVFLFGCNEKGQARASIKELVGSYETEFNNGKERLTLNDDRTFSQVFVTLNGQIIITKGKWTLSNDFLGPTEILLIGNYASEDSLQGSKATYGDRYLIVHKEHGRLRLALNETVGSYYDRIS